MENEPRYTSIVEIDDAITELENQFEKTPTREIMMQINKLCKLANVVVGWKRYQTIQYDFA